MQLGTFLPMMRSHGTGVRREIFLYGERGETVRDALEAAVRRRYALMPYLYSVAAETALSRGGWMRPLFADFPQDPAVRDIAQEFLVGRELLVAPVVRPQAKVWKVYLPKGCDWWNLETGERLVGGRSVELAVTLDSVPRFARAGSVLPIGPDVQWNGERSWDDLEVRVYPGADGEFALHEDDFTTFAYERGERTTIRFKWHERTSTLEISAREGSFPGQLAHRRFRVVLPDGRMKAVDYDGKAASVSFAGFAGGANPITAEGEFLSDPAPRVGPDGTLWIFGSRDRRRHPIVAHGVCLCAFRRWRNAYAAARVAPPYHPPHCYLLSAFSPTSSLLAHTSSLLAFFNWLPGIFNESAESFNWLAAFGEVRSQLREARAVARPSYLPRGFAPACTASRHGRRKNGII